MLGSVGSIVPKRWVLGIFALGLIATMVATSANPWAGAATLPTTVDAEVISDTQIKVTWVAVDGGSTVPGSGVVDGYSVSCVGTPGTETETVSGIATTTVTVDSLTANTAYICSVFASSTSTLPGSGVAAPSRTTPASLATQLGSVVVSPASGSVQNGSTESLTAVTKGADSSKTLITGLTINWSISGDGTVSASTGETVTYTATGDGNATVTASATQSATGITKSVNVVFNNFAAPAPEVVEVPQASSPTEQATQPDISDKPSGTAAAGVFDATSGATEFNVNSPGDSSTTTTTVNFPANAISNGDGSVSVEVFSSSPTEVDTYVDIGSSGGDAIVPISGAGSITIDIKDASGSTASVTTNGDVAVTFSVNVEILDIDFDSISMFKTDDPLVGPWTELATTFTIVDGKVQFEAKTRNFSTFMLGSKSRDIGTGGSGAVLPSAGDAAPTTTQALLLAGLGLMLVVGGGVYVRRQRRATAID